MAIVTKPMALDESMNTTESTSRNIADVLAQELSGIASAITGGDGKANKTDIATVESTNTASRAYSVGELVYVNGNLYKVITAITSGATFTVGTNIQSTNVSGTVEDALDVTTGQATVPTGMFSSVAYNKIVKKGNLVFVQFGGVLASGVTGSNTVVLNIPSAFRASQSERLFSSLTYNDSLLVAYLCGTDSSGDVVLSVGSGQVTGLISIMGVYTI